MGRLGSGALPLPTAGPLGGLPGPTTHWLWVRGGAGVGTRHQPKARTLSSWFRGLWGRHEGAWGGAPLAWLWGVRGRGLSQPRLPALWAGCRGPILTGCGCGGPRAWERVTNPTVRALASWLCSLWGQHEGARGGRLLPGCGASGVGRSPTPGCPPSGRAAGAHYPLAVGAGGCGRGDPSPTPQRALFRAGFARCWGSTRAPGGGRLLPGCGASGVGRCPTPDCPPPGRTAGAHYPLAVGAGGCGRWDPSQTPQRAPASWLCALWGRHEGARRSACCLGVGRPGSGALPPPTARPLSGLPGPTTHWLWLRGGAGVGTRHQPHSARFCELALRAVGAARGRSVWGVRCRALSHPRLPALCAGCRGPLPTGCGCGGLRTWGPVTNPTARALASWLCSLWGRHEGAWGGASCLGVGRPGSGALPPPTARPLGGLPGTTTHWLWVRGGAGVGTHHQPDSARSFKLALRAVGAARGRPGGGASCLGVRRPGSGALPPPTARPLGGLPGRTTHWLWVRGAAGVGTRHQPHSARFCELALRAVGAA